MEGLDPFSNLVVIIIGIHYLKPIEINQTSSPPWETLSFTSLPYFQPLS